MRRHQDLERLARRESPGRSTADPSFFRMLRRLKGQPGPAQLSRTVALGGRCVTRSLWRRVPDQRSETLERLRLPSSWSPQGGLAFTTRPGLQVATKLANRVDGWRARIR